MPGASARAATNPQTRDVHSREDLSQMESFYGYGWSVRRDGVFAHGGSEGTYAWVDPKTKVVGLFFTQGSSGGLRRRFQKIVEASIR